MASGVNSVGISNSFIEIKLIKLMSLDFDTKIDLDKAWESFLEIDQRELESKYFNKKTSILKIRPNSFIFY